MRNKREVEELHCDTCGRRVSFFEKRAFPRELCYWCYIKEVCAKEGHQFTLQYFDVPAGGTDEECDVYCDRCDTEIHIRVRVTLL